MLLVVVILAVFRVSFEQPKLVAAMKGHQIEVRDIPYSLDGTIGPAL